MMPKEWPTSVREHVVVTEAGPDELAIPVGVYVDSAQYGGAAGAGRAKSILVMSIVNFISGLRHIGIVFRRHVARRCGCRGR
eukprot:2158077-Pyramimonas_sp.AAC.1